jgi:hypothetical protein
MIPMAIAGNLAFLRRNNPSFSDQQPARLLQVTVVRSSACKVDAQARTNPSICFGWAGSWQPRPDPVLCPPGALLGANPMVALRTE